MIFPLLLLGLMIVDRFADFDVALVSKIRRKSFNISPHFSSSAIFAVDPAAISQRLLSA